MPPDDDAHYTLTLLNHQTGQKLTIEMIDLPFPCRRYNLRVNGERAKKLPDSTKSEVMRKLRKWWVAH